MVEIGAGGHGKAPVDHHQLGVHHPRPREIFLDLEKPGVMRRVAAVERGDDKACGIGRFQPDDHAHRHATGLGADQGRLDFRRRVQVGRDDQHLLGRRVDGIREPADLVAPIGPGQRQVMPHAAEPVGGAGLQGACAVGLEIAVPQRQVMSRDIAHGPVIAEAQFHILVDRVKSQVLKCAFVIGVQEGPVLKVERFREEEAVMQVAPAEDVA